MKIAIISAMNEEIAPTIKNYNCQKITNINGQDTYEYRGENKTFYFLNSGIGKVNAAITTTLVISELQPDRIISIGTAGGLNSNLKISDFVIANQIGFWDVDVTAFNYKPGQLPQEEQYFKINNYEKLVAEVAKLETNYHVGTIMTGDSFVHKKEQQDYILNTYENVYACDMESASIVFTAQKLGVDVQVLRTISDLADNTSSMYFNEYINIVSNQFKKMVTNLDEK